MIWQLLPTISAPMSFQMALDEKLFLKAKNDPEPSPMLRFYYSSGPWITVGCSFREADGRLGSELIKANPKVPIAKRVTGGGCVLHGQDLIFSLIVRTNCVSGKLGSVRESYQKIHECVAAAFQQSGFDPRIYTEAEELPRGNDCFTYPVASDLSWKGKKLAGGAQKRSGGVLLHHESIRIPDGMDPGGLIEAIRTSFEHVFNIKFENTNLDQGLFFEVKRISRLTTND